MALAITSLSIQAGTTNGGTAITLTGTDFTNTTQIYFDETLADSIVYVSPTSMTCDSPAWPAVGFANVIAVDGDVSSDPTPEDRFYFYSPLSSPNIVNQNIYFDPQANYVFFGDVVFAKDPLFASGGGGSAFDPASNQTITGAWSFTGGFGVSGAHAVSIATSGANNISLTSGQNISVDASSNGTLSLLDKNGCTFNGGALTSSRPSFAWTVSSGAFTVDCTAGNIVFTGVGSGGGTPLGAPTNSPAAGWEFIIRETATGQLKTFVFTV